MTSINQNVDALLDRTAELTNTSGISVSGIQNELETLFVDNSTFNGGEEGVQKIESQIADLEAKIGELEEKAQDILSEIEEKNENVGKKSDELSDTASKLTGATGDLRTETKEAARMAARDAILSYKNGKGDQKFADCFNEAFQKRLGGLQGRQNEIQLLYSLYESQQSGITSIAAEIETALDRVDALETQLQGINATISLLEKTKNNMENSSVTNAYQNIDTNSDVPVLSGAKSAVAAEIISNAALLANDAGITQDAANAEPARDEEALNSAMEEYAAKNNGTGYNATWYATMSKNPQLQNLNTRINDENMIGNLLELGATPEEIIDFISDNWNVGIQKTVNSDGSISYMIPNNSGSESVYSAINELALSANETQETETPDSAHTDLLKDYGLDALDKMYEAGFTFKEAMYTMSKAFPDCGIEYDINNQSTRNYQIAEDTEETGTLYSDIQEKILNYWNVGATSGNFGSGTITTTRQHCDPMVFRQGDTTYTFITDRDNDGTFDYTDGNNNELLGSMDGASELLQYDYNNDGIIDENDISEDGTSALDELTLMINRQDESVGSSEDVDAYKNGPDYTNSVDFNLSYSSARDLGITSIDLSGLTGQEALDDAFGGDVNSTIEIGNFTINTDGVQLDKTINAKETLNSEENLDIFYGQIAESNNNAGSIKNNLTEKDVTDALNNAASSEVIENVKESLNELLEAQPDDDYTIGDVVLTRDDINNITGMGYLTGIRDAARKAAERHLNNSSDAADAAEEAVDDYYEKNIDKTNKDEDEDEK